MLLCNQFHDVGCKMMAQLNTTTAVKPLTVEKSKKKHFIQLDTGIGIVIGY